MIACVVNPEAFVIGGGVSKAGNIILDYIVDNFKNTTFRGCKETDFRLATLGNDAGIYGAAKLVIE
jgi:glucokinase